VESCSAIVGEMDECSLPNPQLAQKIPWALKTDAMLTKATVDQHELLIGVDLMGN
jgi:hypothetical protein